MIEWETGEITSEPLTFIARRQSKLLRLANQAKLRSFRLTPKYKYDYEVPCNYKHAQQIDLGNGNTKWESATHLEMNQLDDYNTFINHSANKPPDGYKKIKVYLIFDIKHNGRHNVRCVADGNLTNIPVESVYSGVVSLRGLQMMLFLAELNKLDI